jgi:hypothetical protein
MRFHFNVWRKFIIHPNTHTMQPPLINSEVWCGLIKILGLFWSSQSAVSHHPLVPASSGGSSPFWVFRLSPCHSHSDCWISALTSSTADTQVFALLEPSFNCRPRLWLSVPKLLTSTNWYWLTDEWWLLIVHLASKCALCMDHVENTACCVV